ncbi:glycoside hydrolase family 5 protein [Ideonella azotifigens]|uniref:Glycoside hydrolase family 5 domain-containing protein n=1 Tax=Ideonella azotifigens TaxID=513160 RepID=A0ABP3V4R4_9BURK|nr:glycoside hydrolase family 5 protein [Ideonella azotifigens]MCD2341079.1 glycoside hydrolase family 5 protein [Ideonella azotifigens]
MPPLRRSSLVLFAALAGAAAHAGNLPAGYAKCATEGQTCSFKGARQVAYGAAGKFAYGTYVGGVACTLASFGGVDPNPAKPAKVCSYNKQKINTSSPVPAYRGVSLAGAEFGADPWGGGSLPGTYGVNYTYPTQGEVGYFAGKQMNTVRLPFRWERLQPTLNAAFDSAEWGRLNGFVAAATASGVTVVLDPHNYARYYSNVVGAGVSNAAFADLWSRLATAYKGNDKVVFALMNEPHDMPTEQWLGAANAAIAAIRAAGAGNLILVPGNGWTGGHSWSDTWYGTSNATVMLGVVDPADRYAYEVHQYLDSDSSGNSANCVSTTIGVERLSGFTAWLRSHGKRGFLGEFAGGNNATCQAAVTGMLDHLGANRDVWNGWTWWAAGPWWGSYMYSIEPQNGVDAPQMGWLTPYLP